jgi:hypothetical protein
MGHRLLGKVLVGQDWLPPHVLVVAYARGLVVGYARGLVVDYARGLVVDYARRRV